MRSFDFDAGRPEFDRPRTRRFIYRVQAPTTCTIRWTAERRDQAKHLWQRGYTASQIARDLGGTTRNAVIGVLYRAGLIGTLDKKLSRARKQQSEQNKAHRSAKRMAKKHPLGASPSSRQRRAPELTQVPQTVAPALTLSDMKLIPLVETSYRQCKFIPGNDRLCCGLPVRPGTSWCEAHYRIVFEPIKPKRERRAA